MPVVRRGPNLDNSTMYHWNYAIYLTSLKNNEKRKQKTDVQRIKEIKLAENRIAGSLHICKNCLAMFESHDKKVRGSLCADCTKIETSTNVRKCKIFQPFTTQNEENKSQNVIICDIPIESGLKKENANKGNKIFAKIKEYVWPYSKAVTCMNVDDKGPSKKTNKSSIRDLGIYENKFKQIVKVVRSKNSDGSVSEERKTITIKTEKNTPSRSKATSTHSSGSVRKNTNVASSKKDASTQNINVSKSQTKTKTRHSKSEKITLTDTMASPRLKTSLSDDTIKVKLIDSNNTSKADGLTKVKEKSNVRLIYVEEKAAESDEPCVHDIPQKKSKVRIKDVCSIHALRPAQTLMKLSNNQKAKSPVDNDNFSLLSFATSYSLDEDSIQMSAHEVFKSEPEEGKTVCTEDSDNKLEKNIVWSPSYIEQIGIDDDAKTKMTSTNARWRDAGASTSDSTRIFNISSYTKVSTPLLSTNHNACGHVFEGEETRIEQPCNSDTNINESNTTETDKSNFSITCQSTDRCPKLIDEFGFKLPTSKMFTNFPEMVEIKNVCNKRHNDRPVVKSIDYKSNEKKWLEEMYNKMKNRQNVVASANSEPSTAFPSVKKELRDKLQSDSMSRFSHDIPIRTRMHNESPRVSGEIIYSHLDPKFVRKCNKTVKINKKSQYLAKCDAMVETDIKIMDIKMPVTESRGTSPVGSFPLIPLKINEIVQKKYVNSPEKVAVATSPDFSLAKLPVISTSSQLTLTPNIPKNELPKISNIITPDQRNLKSDSICEIKIVPKNFECNSLISDTEVTIERLKQLLKANKAEDFDKIIYPTVKKLTKMPDDTNFSRTHVVCPATPVKKDEASSCNRSSSCENPECPVKKMCCPPKPKETPEEKIEDAFKETSEDTHEPKKRPEPPKKIDVGVSTFERDIPKRKVDQRPCKSACAVPKEMPKCAKCRAMMMRVDASTNTKANARYDVRPLSKLFLAREITETKSDSCLYCGTRFGHPRFRGVVLRVVKSPVHSSHSCVKPMLRAQSTPTNRFLGCDC